MLLKYKGTRFYVLIKIIKEILYENDEKKNEKGVFFGI